MYQSDLNAGSGGKRLSGNNVVGDFNHMIKVETPVDSRMASSGTPLRNRRT